MNGHTRFAPFLAAALPFSLGMFLLPGTGPAHPISETAKDGAYSVTLKVLPAEAFTGPKAEMVADNGASPVELKGMAHPNHHLVVFVTRNGKPVEHADVTIQYRPVSKRGGPWTEMPVVRMHVADKGPETTHYGNNVALKAGKYAAHVTVNEVGPVTFRFTLAS
jgi:hypothetical protein